MNCFAPTQSRWIYSDGQNIDHDRAVAGRTGFDLAFCALAVELVRQTARRYSYRQRQYADFYSHHLNGGGQRGADHYYQSLPLIDINHRGTEISSDHPLITQIFTDLEKSTEVVNKKHHY